MCCNNKTLINEKYGLAIWCSNKGCIKLCFANLILYMPVEELKDFMRGLYNAFAIENSTNKFKEVSVFIMPTPMQNMQLAFTPNEQRYLLDLCQRSILLAEELILAN